MPKTKYAQLKEAARLVEEHGIVETQDLVVIDKKRYEEWLRKMRNSSQINRAIFQRPS